MDILNLNDDSFEFIECEGHFSYSEITDTCNFDDELNDILFPQPSNCPQLQLSPLRPIDLPSHRKHYGLLSFYQYHIPIIYRYAIFE